MTAEPKQFDMSGLQPFYAGTDEAALPNVNARLEGNGRHVTRQAKRLLARLQKTRACVRTLEQLPAADESIHCLLSGEFALFDFIPAILELSGAPADELLIATLGFSKANVESLGQLVDTGQVKSLAIACSTYFAAADKPIFDQAVELCQKHGFRIAPLRTHAKVLGIATGTHRIVVESSANLRSCHNVEQASCFNDPALYEFHRTWIDQMLTKGGA